VKRIACGLMLFLLPGTALAEPTQADLRQIERQIQEERAALETSGRRANELSGEVKNVQQQMVQLARVVQQKEDDLTRLENRQKQIIARQKELEKQLALTDRQMVQVVTGLQTLALRPPELALMRSNTPMETIRSRMLMGYGLPIVQGANRQIRSDLSELSQLRRELQEQIVRMKSTQLQLSEQSDQMDRLLKQKSIMQAQYRVSQEQSAERVKSLGAQARDLKDLLDRLENERQKAAYNVNRYRDMNRPQPTVSQQVARSAFEKAFGRLPYPIRGTITGSFGAVTASGAHTKGITITGRAGARVIAPFDGTVLFAGPFKSYGELIILDHGDNYLTLLAGMDKINPSVGQEVLAGEPIGIMKQAKPELYIEIRQNGQAVDPEPWFLKQS